MNNQKIVRRLNRKAAFLRLDNYIGWGIALALVALYGCIHGVTA